MPSSFLTRDTEEPVTKDYYRAVLETEIRVLRAEIAEIRADIWNAETVRFRADMHRAARDLKFTIVTGWVFLAVLLLVLNPFD